MVRLECQQCRGLLSSFIGAVRCYAVFPVHTILFFSLSFLCLSPLLIIVVNDSRMPHAMNVEDDESLFTF